MKRGFTLLETLVAVSLITIAVVGPFVAAQRAYRSAIDSKNRLMASYLAQEGIEYVRMLRDNTYLADARDGVDDLSVTSFYSNFLGGLSAAPTSVNNCLGDTSTVAGGDGSKACALDTSLPVGVGSDKALQPCSTPTSCERLYLSSSGQYNLSSTGTDTIFTRSIRFYDLDPLVEVVSTVSWTDRGSTRTIVLTGYLSPWL